MLQKILKKLDEFERTRAVDLSTVKPNQFVVDRYLW